MVLVQIGEIRCPAASAIFQGIKEALEAHLPVKCSILEERAELPSRAWDGRRGQYRVQGFLRLLKGLSPTQRSISGPGSGRESGKPAPILVLGITDVDIYSAGLNFVFGSASTSEGVAVISLYRLNPGFYYQGRRPDLDDEGLLLRRARKEAVHEVGHLLGLGHCPDPGCVMSFSNSILDVDRKGEELCGRCRGLISGQERRSRRSSRRSLK